MKRTAKLIGAAVAAVLALMLAAGCDTGNSDETVTPPPPAAPWMMTFDDGATAGITVAAGYLNTYAGALALTVADKETDTGYTPIDSSLAGVWVDTGLNLGTKSLNFEIRSNTASGHVELNFADIAGMDRTDRTGFTFTLKFSNAPAGAGIGLTPLLRKKVGDDVNVACFGKEMWYYKTDASYYVVKIPFSDFSNFYGPATDTTIAALPSTTVFNHLTFDIRVSGAPDFAIDTTYDAIIDNVGFY